MYLKKRIICTELVLLVHSRMVEKFSWQNIVFYKLVNYLMMVDGKVEEHDKLRVTCFISRANSYMP